MSIKTACGRLRPLTTRNCISLSSVAESDPDSVMMGYIFASSSPKTSDCSAPDRARIQLRLPPAWECVGAESRMNDREGGLKIRIGKIRIIPPELLSGEHALVNDAVAGEHADVEDVFVRLADFAKLNDVFGALADQVHPAVKVGAIVKCRTHAVDGLAAARPAALGGGDHVDSV